MTEDNIPSLLTFRQFCEKHKAFCVGGLRYRINLDGQSMVEAGAMLRLGAKILIDEVKFFQWLRDNQRQHKTT